MSTAVQIGLNGGVRLHFPHLLEAWAGAQGDQEPKYSCALLIDKQQAAADIELIRKAISAEMAAKGWTGTSRPAQLRIGIHDGDEKIKDAITGEESYKKSGDEFRNQFYLSARSSQPPGVVVGKSQREANPNDIVAGYYVAASLDVFTYTKSGAGVGFGLQNIWVRQRGEALMSAGVRRDASEDFGTASTEDADDFDVVPPGNQDANGTDKFF